MPSAFGCASLATCWQLGDVLSGSRGNLVLVGRAERAERAVCARFGTASGAVAALP